MDRRGDNAISGSKLAGSGSVTVLEELRAPFFEEGSGVSTLGLPAAGADSGGEATTRDKACDKAKRSQYCL
jgi:hypothetical protein